YFSCSPRTHRPITWRLSAAARRPVLALDYRQGPVHKLADPLSDALGAYHCLLERGDEAGDMTRPGDPAGGHLALATLRALRDRAGPSPGGGRRRRAARCSPAATARARCPSSPTR